MIERTNNASINNSASLSSQVIEALREASLPACFFKPRETVAASLFDPKKDLDLLVRKTQIAQANAVLTQSGFFPIHQGLGETTWLGMDPDSRQLIRIDLHDSIRLGRSGVKPFALPNLEHLFRNMEEDPHGVSVLTPSLDAVLFAIRVLVDAKFSDGTLQSKPTLSAVHQAQQRLASVSADEVREHCRVLLNKPHALDAMFGPALEELETVQCAVSSSLTRQVPPHEERLRFGANMVTSFWSHRTQTVPEGALLPPVAPMIALIGSDGSGKSTMFDMLLEWLSNAIAVEQVYLGRGEWFSRSIDKVVALRQVVQGQSRSVPTHTMKEESQSAPSAHASGDVRRARDTIEALSQVALAQRRLSDLKEVRRLRSLGCLVLSDRFPHPTEAMCDGPRIDTLGKHAVGRDMLKQIEQAYHQRMAAFQPSLVLHLHAPAEVCFERKPDHDLEEMRLKVEGAMRAQYPGAKKVTLDATTPLAILKQQVQDLVFDHLRMVSEGAGV